MVLRYINVRSSQRSEFIDITEKINEVIKEAGILSEYAMSMFRIQLAAVTINEGADPSVHPDIQNALPDLSRRNELLPQGRKRRCAYKIEHYRDISACYY